MLAWYRRHRRDLPWRRQPTPYRVLLSEFMLQQTQVATVIDYFNRFTAALPTVRDLAEADEQQVLRLWQGLGYYRRAKHLHAAAKAIVARHGGDVPGEVEALAALPGVGRYTAGAIASIAFGVRAPILDGNVARVLARWYALDDPIDAPATRTRLWQLADALTPAADPGDFNQSLMELGATVCTPRGPRCLTCPAAGWCGALARGVADELPRRLPRRRPKAVTHHVLALARRGQWLLVQRPERGLWAGLWQLPTCEALAQATGEALAMWAHETLGLTITPPREGARFDHQTTHRSITFTLWRAQVTAGRLRGSGQWRALDRVDDLPLANPQRRAIALLREPADSPESGR
jgi:A/G-specific adenine glycosylase